MIKKLISILIGLLFVVAVGSVVWYVNFGDEEGYYAFIPNSTDGTISIYDSTKGEITSNIKVSEENLAHGIEITPDGQYLYTGMMGGQEILVLDPFTGDEVTTINIGKWVYILIIIIK
ncbi:YncE family protein [Anaerobacillus sp. MEB173]|uniref:YncE family protein n=1 Tax=Anaerobacillus sp. MEB173 TaxID=3383345 RepID=UPI003F8E2696